MDTDTHLIYGSASGGTEVHPTVAPGGYSGYGGSPYDRGPSSSPATPGSGRDSAGTSASYGTGASYGGASSGPADKAALMAEGEAKFGMKWFKFMIYFGLFAGVLVCISNIGSLLNSDMEMKKPGSWCTRCFRMDFRLWIHDDDRRDGCNGDTDSDRKGSGWLASRKTCIGWFTFAYMVNLGSVLESYCYGSKASSVKQGLTAATMGMIQ